MRRTFTKTNSQPRWLFPFVSILCLVLCALPLLRLMAAGFAAVAHGNALAIFEDGSVWRATLNTFTTSALGMVVAVIIGGVFAFVLALCDLRGRGALSFLFMLPMMIPPQITALSWVGLSGPSSPLLKALALAPPLGSPQPLYSIGGIALLLGVQNAPLVFLSLRAGLLSLPLDGVEAARLAGARPLRAFIDIILPLTAPGLIAGAAMSFVSGVGNFGIPAILGIPASIYTLPTLIQARLSSFGPNTFAEIALLSVLIALMAVAGLGVQERALRGRDHKVIGGAGLAAHFSAGRWRIVIEAGLWLSLGVMLFAPLLALVAGSLAPAYGVPLSLETISFHAYGEILLRQTVTRTAFFNSIFLSSLTALCLLVFGVLTAYSLTRSHGVWAKAVAALIDIPYALPGIIIAVAFILLFAAPVPLLGISLYGTLWIILLAYLSSFFAVGLKPIISAIRQLDPALEEAARLSGAGFWRRLKDIVIPAIAPAAGASVILVFLMACNELTISALLWSAGTQTLGVAIYNLDDSGSYDMASALSVLVVVMILIMMLALESLSSRLPKGVAPWRS